jgi:1-aminocyclopropane-1-carboxylate deaminase/D-cysteine desulfhydrase-like pyridoxal-dependent ACC family enzyme
MLPFGLECAEAVRAVAGEASSVPIEAVQGGTVVISAGSGVTLAGLLLGLRATPERLIAISSGRSISKISACVRRYVRQLPRFVDILEPRYPYDIALDYPCPFPSHPNYDRKAWKYLVENVSQLQEPILFWNVGA